MLLSTSSISIYMSSINVLLNTSSISIYMSSSQHSCLIQSLFHRGGGHFCKKGR